ncbi:MAG: hypothetical protein A3E78_11235 [Alphaproteobacteria bacterium RIFCSPHIGHO2_12_FULL_63_12]|nr:MAG: hypothetical protein A3E78_11235 [Alphaproteobacteria bacterium RIFCSPHIGHO2_12_FULL_63_12]
MAPARNLIWIGAAGVAATKQDARMAESLKAVIIIFTISLGGFVYARAAFGEIVDGRTIDRWRNVFLAATLAAFLIPNFWLFLFAVGLIAIALGASEKNKPALYLVLLFALPVADAIVPGFGGIQNFLALFPFNILAIVILWPMLFARQENRELHPIGSIADYFFIAYSLLMLALAFRDTTVTDGFRQSTAFILTTIGPYLVFSRINWTKERLKATTLAFVLPLIIMSAIALVEVVLRWHPYKSAIDHWDIAERVRYTFRSGYLRAFTSVFAPISFGLFLAAAVPLAMALISSMQRKMLAIGGLAALGVGLLATFSRGPWIGAALAVVAFVFTSDRPFKNLTRLGLIGTAGFLALSVTPIGDQIIGLLPFVGDSSTSSIDYREQLMDIGWSVAMETRWFGSEDFMSHPAMQQLVQGQGIIDIVNSYLRVTLESGLVGLFLFVGVSFFSALSAWRAIGAARAADPEFAVYGQAWLAALASTLLVIATTSSVVAQVAEVHWLLCGMCVGFARSAEALRLAAPATAPANIPPEPPPPPRAAAPKPSIAAHSLPPHLRQYADREK